MSPSKRRAGSAKSRSKLTGAKTKKTAPASWALALGRTLSYAQAHPETAKSLLDLLQAACESLAAGAQGQGNHVAHDEVMHALGTALVRVGQIQGDSEAVRASLHSGVKVLNYASTYWRIHQNWPALDEGQIDSLQEALSYYEDILMASSPMQMEKAWREHLVAVQEASEGLNPKLP